MFGIICGEQIFCAINAGCVFAIICSEALGLCVKTPAPWVQAWATVISRRGALLVAAGIGSLIEHCYYH